MKRRHFVTLWCAIRTYKLRLQVKAGEMRPSEMAMTMAGLEKDATNLWAKHRATFKIADSAWLLRATNVAECDHAKVLESARKDGYVGA